MADSFRCAVVGMKKIFEKMSIIVDISAELCYNEHVKYI